jgi:hypothetical protein
MMNLLHRGIGAIVLAVLPALTACSTIYPPAAGFAAASKEYNRLLRWQEREQAAVSFVAPAIREPYQERLRAAKEVRIVDYRPKSVEFRQEGTEATATVELDYYRTDTNRVRTLEDRQLWRYEPELGWQLRSLLPEFK